MEAIITFIFFLEIYTLSMYADVVSYVIRKPEIRHVYGRQSKKISGSRIFCMDLNEVVQKINNALILFDN